MESTIQGRVYKFGDNINSDIIIPGRYLIYIDRERLAQHAFEVSGRRIPGQAARVSDPGRGPQFRLRQRARAGGDGDSRARNPGGGRVLLRADVLSQRDQ